MADAGVDAANADAGPCTAAADCEGAFDNGIAECVAGECTLNGCEPSYDDCDGEASNGCENRPRHGPVELAVAAVQRRPPSATTPSRAAPTGCAASPARLALPIATPTGSMDARPTSACRSMRCVRRPRLHRPDAIVQHRRRVLVRVGVRAGPRSVRSFMPRSRDRPAPLRHVRQRVPRGAALDGVVRRLGM